MPDQPPDEQIDATLLLSQQLANLEDRVAALETHALHARKLSIADARHLSDLELRLGAHLEDPHPTCS